MQRLNQYYWGRLVVEIIRIAFIDCCPYQCVPEKEGAAVFAYITTKAGIRDKFEVAESLGKNVQHLEILPENPNHYRHIEIYDKGIREMRANGRLKKILLEY